MGSSGDHMGVGHRVRVKPRRHQARDVGHVHHQVGAHLVGDLAHLFKVDETGVGAAAGDDELGTALLRLLEDLVIVDGLGVRLHAVELGVEVFAGDGGPGAVGQVTAVGQVHAQDGVMGLEQGDVHRHVGIGAGVGLDVGVLRAKKLLGPLDGQILDLVHILAAAVVAGGGIALGIFVGEMAAHGLQHRGAHKVFRGDQLDMIPLPLQLPHHGGVDLRVLSLDGIVIRAHDCFSPIRWFSRHYTAAPFPMSIGKAYRRKHRRLKIPCARFYFNMTAFSSLDGQDPRSRI